MNNKDGETDRAAKYIMPEGAGTVDLDSVTDGLRIKYIRYIIQEREKTGDF